MVRQILADGKARIPQINTFENGVIHKKMHNKSNIVADGLQAENHDR